MALVMNIPSPGYVLECLLESTRVTKPYLSVLTVPSLEAGWLPNRDASFLPPIPTLLGENGRE